MSLPEPETDINSAVVELTKDDYARLWAAVHPLGRLMDKDATLDRENLLLYTRYGQRVVFTFGRDGNVAP